MPRWSAAIQVGHDSLAQRAALLTEGTERREPRGGVAWTWLLGTWDCLLSGATGGEAGGPLEGKMKTEGQDHPGELPGVAGGQARC